MQTAEYSAPNSQGVRGTLQFAFCLSAAFLATGIAPSQESSPIRRIQTDHTVLTRDWFAYSVDENLESTDFNGDGDTEDQVIRVQVFATGEETTLPFAVTCWAWWLEYPAWPQRTDRINVPVAETAQGGDLNGDGDLDDVVLLVHDLSTRETVDQGVVAPDTCVSPWIGDFEILHVHEAAQGEDLNGDGDEEDVVIQIRDLVVGETRNLRLALAGYAYRVRRWAVFAVSEARQAADLNGDKDVEDIILHIHEFSTRTTTNLGLAVVDFGFGPPGFESPMDGDKISIRVLEQNVSLNSDNDTDDAVAHLHTLSTGETTNLGLAAITNTVVVGDWVAVMTSELADNKDLDGDGFLDGWVFRIVHSITGEIRNLASGTVSVRGDGDWLALVISEGILRQDLDGNGGQGDDVAFLYNVATGELTNLGLPVSLFIKQASCVLGNYALVPDVDAFTYLVDLEHLASVPRFLRGDCNDDGKTNIADPVCVLIHLFGGGPAPTCLQTADANDDNAVDIADPVYQLNHLFGGGPALSAPAGECGTDPTPAGNSQDDLSCEAYPACQA